MKTIGVLIILFGMQVSLYAQNIYSKKNELAIEPYKLNLNSINRSLQFPKENKTFLFKEDLPFEKPFTSIELTFEKPNHRNLFVQSDEMIFSSNMPVYSPSMISNMPIAKPDPSVYYHINIKRIDIIKGNETTFP